MSEFRIVFTGPLFTRSGEPRVSLTFEIFSPRDSWSSVIRKALAVKVVHLALDIRNSCPAGSGVRSSNKWTNERQTLEPREPVRRLGERRTSALRRDSPATRAERCRLGKCEAGEVPG